MSDFEIASERSWCLSCPLGITRAPSPPGSVDSLGVVMLVGVEVVIVIVVSVIEAGIEG